MVVLFMAVIFTFLFRVKGIKKIQPLNPEPVTLIFNVLPATTSFRAAPDVRNKPDIRIP